MKDEGVFDGMDFILHPSSFRLPFSAFVRGTGALEEGDGALRFVTTDANAAQYSDAQIDDYQALSRRNFLWRPPLRMSVRARFSHPAGALRGTAGFGFWNDPFMMTGPRKPALPRALWFFTPRRRQIWLWPWMSPASAGKRPPLTRCAGLFWPCCPWRPSLYR